ncbi:Fatty acid-binding protein [Orchesella cincta]|uniref:Fatty acid-binding protein n=1 Tax=Orchesella cincta TaxID=48709 RepID=A0A1D2N5D4_ORCCI|nr:Fatty acid-binding protein [Orchesella cincta]
MVQIVGTYKLEKNEKLDEFYQELGVPWIARKLMLTSSPTMYITLDEEEQYDFKTVSFLKTTEISFKLNEPYEETMPNGEVFESLTTLEGGNKFTTKSESEGVVAFERIYEFNDDGMVMTLKSPKGLEAKRYFKRLQ